MEVDAEGVVRGAVQVPSPNCDERPAEERITLLVVHSISLPPGEYGGLGVERLFTNSLDCDGNQYFSRLKGLKVSAHFLIRRDGALMQFVPGRLRAWHAGESAWKGRTRCNDFSIGVEIEGADDQPFAAVQYRRLGSLTIALKQRYPIADLVGHSEISPSRKTDPGPLFDWGHYRALLHG